MCALIAYVRRPRRAAAQPIAGASPYTVASVKFFEKVPIGALCAARAFFQAATATNRHAILVHASAGPVFRKRRAAPNRRGKTGLRWGVSGAAVSGRYTHRVATTATRGRAHLLFRRHARLELFEPIEDDAKFWSAGVAGLDQFGGIDEPEDLAVRSEVVVPDISLGAASRRRKFSRHSYGITE